MNKISRILGLLLAAAMLLSMGACGEKNEKTPDEKEAVDKEDATENDNEKKENLRTVVDSRGVTVELPDEIERVAIFDKGFIVQCMTAMGINDKIVAQGDMVQTAVSPKERDSLYLCPKLLEVPNLGYPASAVDYEALSVSDPDIVILRNSEYIKDSEITKEVISKIENDFKIPLVVINGPGCYDEPTVQQQYDAVRIVGEVFEKQDRAEEIISLMDETVQMVLDRTKDIPEEEKPATMFISGFTNSEVTGTVWGGNYGDAKFSDTIMNIKNVYPDNDGLRKASAEQLITMNPDAIILCTVSCTPEELLTDSAFDTIRDITAIKEKRVVSRGLLTWWGDFRLEVPTILLITAKGVYPEKFEDINVSEWLNDYHMELYGLNEEQAQDIKVAQQLDWMDKEGF